MMTRERSMYPLPPRPRGCEILAQRFDDSLILTWREFVETGWAIIMWLYYGGQLLVWTALGIAFLVAVVLKGVHVALILLPAWCFIWLYLASLLRIFTGIRHAESVTLTPTELTYDPGPSPFLMVLANDPFAFYRHNPFRPMSELFWRRRVPLRCAKNSVALQLQDGHLRLSTSETTLDIGRELVAKDRRWLHGVLV